MSGISVTPPTDAVFDVWEQNLTAIDRATDAYTVWYKAARWPFTWVNQSPVNFRADLLHKLSRQGLVASPTAPAPLGWTLKVGVVTASITTAVLFAVWAWRRTF